MTWVTSLILKLQSDWRIGYRTPSKIMRDFDIKNIRLLKLYIFKKIILVPFDRKNSEESIGFLKINSKKSYDEL